MALLHVLERLRRSFGLLLSAHGVDHGLRPGAAAELDLAERFATTLGVPFSRSLVSVAAGANLQARAREARYTALRETAARVQADLIATAHHADDRAETVLLRLLRGAGPAGLSVLKARSRDLLRPMIRAEREDVLAHLERHRVPYCHDPSNQDLRFLRVRVRRELLPLLKELSPRIVEHLASLADQAPSSGSPEIRDAEGVNVPLNRAQARELGRMLTRGAFDARIALMGGREIRLDRATGRPKVVVAASRTVRTRATRRQTAEAGKKRP